MLVVQLPRSKPITSEVGGLDQRINSKRNAKARFFTEKCGGALNPPKTGNGKKNARRLSDRNIYVKYLTTAVLLIY